MFTKTLLASVAILLVATTNADYDVNKYCKLVKTGTKLPSLTSCKIFYICPAKGDYTEGTCPGTTVFSKDAQGCVDQSESSCFDGSGGNPCVNRNGTFLPNSQSCTNQWVYCLNGQVSHGGMCPINQVFSTQSGSCIYGKCTPTVDNGNDQTDVQDLCDIMPSGLFFGDFEECNGYHKCSDMKQTDGNCKNGLVFDAKNGMCLKDNGNMCQRIDGDGVIVTPESGPPQGSCNSTDQIVGDLNMCSVYYKCQLKPAAAAFADAETPAETPAEKPAETPAETPTEKPAETPGETPGETPTETPAPVTTTKEPEPETTAAPETDNYEWVQYTCNNNQFFDVLKKTCQSKTTASPYPGCNRCQYGVGDPYWVNVVSSTCDEYNTCKNGQMTTAPINGCGPNNFFNEDIQYCIQGNKTMATYIANHGACQGYTCDDATRVCTAN